MSTPSSFRDRLRRLPALAGPLPSFDPRLAPPDPVDLFLRWFDEAVEAGVPEPHAMTVSTADADGVPSSRVVVLKDLRDGAWEFATDARSAKAQDLTATPHAAVSFYWQPQGRQVRIRGSVAPRSAEESAADFLARSPASRAAALAVRPGEPLTGTDALEQAFVAARQQVEQEPGLVLPQWRVYAVTPAEVEFWQGDPGRAHVRLRYHREAGQWVSGLRWP